MVDIHKQSADAPRRAGARPKRNPTKVTLDQVLVEEAKALSVNLSQAAEAGVAEAGACKCAEKWLAENRDALESSNTYVERHGLPLARYSRF